MILKKLFLLPRGRGYEAFEEFEEHQSTIRQIVPKWKHSRRLPIFSGVDTPANSPQGQIMQRQNIPRATTPPQLAC